MMTDLWASHSQLVQYRRCPQAWQYAHVRRLEQLPDPDDPKVEMHFGSWWHMLLAADSIYRARLRGGTLRVLPKHLAAVDDGPRIEGADLDSVDPYQVIALSEGWYDRLPPETKTAWLDRVGETLPDRLQHLFERWYAQWETEISTEEPLAVELYWRRDLAFDTILVGYVDEVYYDTKRRLVVVRDHKTAKALATQTTVDDMMDSQLQLYAWGAAPVIEAWGLGTVAATSYDRARSVAPKPPTLTQSGRLSTRDGEPSLSGCDLHTYLTWVAGPEGKGVPYPGLKKDGSGAGYYKPESAIIDRLSTPAAQSAWFQRTLTPLNTNLIGAHWQAAVDSAEGIGRTRLRAEVTGEAPRNLTVTCRWCAFVSLCRAEMVGGPGGEYDLADHRLRAKGGPSS